MIVEKILNADDIRYEIRQRRGGDSPTTSECRHLLIQRSGEVGVSDTTLNIKIHNSNIKILYITVEHRCHRR